MTQEKQKLEETQERMTLIKYNQQNYENFEDQL